MRKVVALPLVALLLALVLVTGQADAQGPPSTAPGFPRRAEVVAALGRGEPARVIVKTSNGPALAALPHYGNGTVPHDDTLSLVELRNVGQLTALENAPGVAWIEPDDTLYLTDAGDDLGAADAAQRTSLGASAVGTGAGRTVVVLDSGYNPTTPFVASSRRSAEGCFAVDATCPGGVTSSGAAGSASWAYCFGNPGCDHGTRVLQIAAGDDPAGTYSGIAPGANVWTIRVFKADLTASTSDLVAALQWVFDGLGSFSSGGIPVASVNMSIGSSSAFQGFCSNAAMEPKIAQLRGAGVSVVVASGNNNSTDGTSFPACLPGSFAVGSTCLQGSCTSSPGVGKVSTFTDMGRATDVLAPGNCINTNDGASASCGSGTSYAAPAVAGMVAVLAAADPSSNIEHRELALGATGTLTYDQRGTGWARPRVFGPAADARIDEMVAAGSTIVRTVVPFRALDTRGGFCVRDGYGSGGTCNITKIGAGTATYNVAGMLGLTPGQIKAVVVNLTGLDADQLTYISVGPGVNPAPGWSNLNLAAGQNATAAQVWTKVDASGIVGIRNNAGNVNAIVDFQAIVESSADVGIASEQTRVYDSRFASALGPAGQVNVQITGQAGVPAGATAAIVTVTGIAQTSDTYLSARIGGATGTPTTSTVNLLNGTIRSNMAVVPLNGSGQMSVWNERGSTHVLVDVVGWLTSTSVDVTSVTPTRVVDTRNGTGGTTGPLAAGQTFNATTRTPCGGSAKGVIANVTTTTGGTAGQFVTVWPTGAQQPSVSNVNAQPNDAVANLATLAVSSGGQDSFYSAVAGTQIIVDVVGCVN